jgi:SusD family.
MKTYIQKAIYIFLAVFLFVSCDDFLDENNKSGITGDPFFNTPDGFEGLVNSCYTPVRFWYGKEGGTAMTDLGTDLILAGAGCTHFPLAQYHPTDFNGTNANIKVYWERFYAAVNYCNTALKYVITANISESDRKAREGEVRFLRAFYYWHIVETWGNVHFSDEATAGVEETAYRTPVEKFYEQMMTDLDIAIANLTGSVNDGRVTKAAAEAFKARVLLTRASASYINSSGKENDYAEAATLAKKVINDYGFVLADDYASIWSMDNSDGNRNKEAVWFVNYTKDFNIGIDIPDYQVTNSFRKDGGHQAHLMFAMKYDDQPGFTRDVLNGRPFNRYMPSLRYTQLFNKETDQRYAGTFKEVWLANDEKQVEQAHGKGYPRMAVGDTAIYVINTVATPAQRAAAAGKYQLFDAADVYSNGHDVVLNTKQYIELDKFADPTRATANEVRSSRDAFVIRIAEMYLIVAEASLKSNASEALQYMNTLRRKRAFPGKESEMEITQSELTVDFILDERARELGGEQLRWFDLKRTGKLVEYVKLWNPDAKKNIQSYHVLRPVPQSLLDVIQNKDEFKQNEGYN